LTLETGLGVTAETRTDAGKNVWQTGDKTRTKNQFISSQIFHRTPYRRVQKTTDWEWLKLENLKLFNPVAKEQHTKRAKGACLNWAEMKSVSSKTLRVEIETNTRQRSRAGEKKPTRASACPDGITARAKNQWRTWATEDRASRKTQDRAGEPTTGLGRQQARKWKSKKASADLGEQPEQPENENQSGTPAAGVWAPHGGLLEIWRNEELSLRWWRTRKHAALLRNGCSDWERSTEHKKQITNPETPRSSAQQQR
jgi:hypothetical protein